MMLQLLLFLAVTAYHGASVDSCETGGIWADQDMHSSGTALNIFYGLRFNCTGRVTQWKFFAKNTRKFVASAWREETSGKATLIGRNVIDVQTNGAQVYDVPWYDQIGVQNDDILGIYYLNKGDDNGVVPYVSTGESVPGIAPEDCVPTYAYGDKQGDYELGKEMSLGNSNLEDKQVALRAVVTPDTIDGSLNAVDSIKLYADGLEVEQTNYGDSTNVSMPGYTNTILAEVANSGLCASGFVADLEGARTGKKVQSDDSWTCTDQGVQQEWKDGDVDCSSWTPASRLKQDGDPGWWGPSPGVDAGAWWVGPHEWVNGATILNGATTFTCCKQAGSCVGGGKWTDKDMKGSGTWRNIFYDLKFGCDGRVTQWKFYARETGKTFVAGAWRETADGEKVELIGQNKIDVTELGEQVYNVSEDEQFEVLSTDFIGIHYLQKGDQKGVLAYIQSPSEEDLVEGMNKCELSRVIWKEQTGDFQLGKKVDKNFNRDKQLTLQAVVTKLLYV